MNASLKRFGIRFALFGGALLLASLPRAAGASDLCSGEMEQVLFAAKFRSGTSMRIKIGTLKHAKNPRPLAQIWTREGCEAVCELRALEREGTLKPIALAMECQGVRFSPLMMQASVLWGGNTGRHLAEKPTLRFGTWLEGYTLSELEVEIDRYTTGDKVDRRVAFR